MTALRLVLPSLILSASLLRADPEPLPFGPVGGVVQAIPGTPFVEVKFLQTGAPGDLSGLRAGDVLTGAGGKAFASLSTDTLTGYDGSVRQLGEAIDDAEGQGGALVLTVLRPGTGQLTLTASLPAAGTSPAARPYGSAKDEAAWEWACARIHSTVTGNPGGAYNGYNRGWMGLILLSHPDGNSTTGARPYRNSLNQLRDNAAANLNARILAPVEEAAPAFVDPGLENWEISMDLCFLAEYRAKTGDTSMDTVIQRGADMLANRIQDYTQPDYNGTAGVLKVGLMGHGGVVGDYPHIGYSGINIVNAHAMAALALARANGAAVNETRFAQSWDWVRSCMVLNAASPDDGNVGYAWPQGSYDSGGRTSGVLFAMKRSLATTGGTLPAGEADALGRMESWLSRQHQRLMHTHAYTAGGYGLSAMALPWADRRTQDFIRWNWRYASALQRQPDGSIAWLPGRENNGGDGYLGTDNVALIQQAWAYAAASGALPDWPAPSADRLYLRLASPGTPEPDFAAPRVVLTGSATHTFTWEVTDRDGAPASAAAYAWSQAGGPPGVVFANAAAASTAITFPASGTYRLEFHAVRGTQTSVEPLEVAVWTGSRPDGYLFGSVPYEIYSAAGATLAELTSSPDYPGNPSATGSLTSLASTWSGNDYGQRIRGWIIPPVTGSYRFYIASDDASQFALNATGAAASPLTPLCSVSGWTARGSWTQYASQTSAPVTLTAGQPYRFEVLHKEGGGGDFVDVGWTGPDFPTVTVIDGLYLASEVPPAGAAPVITQDPADIAVNPGDTLTLSAASTFHLGGTLYRWLRAGVPIGGLTTSPVLTVPNAGGGVAGEWRLEVTNADGVALSAPAVVSVTGTGNTVAGGLWRDVFYNLDGNSVSTLTSAPAYPLLADAGSAITAAESPSGFADSYGQRWTGWVIPPVSGDYRFYLTCDDAGEVWLSRDEFAAHRERITSRSSYVSERAWPSVTPSAWIPLVAGQRYYIEVLHKEGGGGDHAAVAWQRNGDPALVAGAAPIEGAYLEYRNGGHYGDAVPVAPLAVEDAAGASWGQPLEVAANDLDADAASLQIIAVSEPAHGTAWITGPRTVAYLAQAGYAGPDSFTYTVRNAQGLDATASVSVTAAATLTDAITAAGPLAHWPLNELSGTAAADTTGSYPGTYSSVALGQSGVHAATGTAGGFTGAGTSRVVIANPAAFNFTGTAEFTLEAWVKFTGTSGVQRVFSNGKYGFGINGGSLLRFTAFGLVDRERSIPAIAPGEWVHTAVTRSGGLAQMYFNGAPAGSPVTLTAINSSTVALQLGRNPSGTEGVDGSIDEAAVYTRPLAAAEIAAHATLGRQPPPGLALTAPADDAVFAAPEDIPLTASVAANGAAVTRVDFYDGATLLGSASAVPWTYVWSGVPAGGVHTVRAVLTHAGGEVHAVPVTVSVLRPLDAWRASQFTPAELADPLVSGDAADTDRDGLDTVMEFALGTDPRSGARVLAAAPSRAAGLAARNRPDGGLDLTLTRPTDRGAVVSYTLQAGSDLEGWAPLAIVPAVEDNGDGTGTLTWQAGAATFPPGLRRVFVRLQVTVP